MRAQSRRNVPSHLFHPADPKGIDNSPVKIHKSNAIGDNQSTSQTYITVVNQNNVVSNINNSNHVMQKNSQVMDHQKKHGPTVISRDSIQPPMHN